MKEQIDEMLKLLNEMFGLVDRITEKMTPELQTYITQQMDKYGYCDDDDVYKVANIWKELHSYISFQLFKKYCETHDDRAREAEEDGPTEAQSLCSGISKAQAEVS